MKKETLSINVHIDALLKKHEDRTLSYLKHDLETDRKLLSVCPPGTTAFQVVRRNGTMLFTLENFHTSELLRSMLEYYSDANDMLEIYKIEILEEKTLEIEQLVFYADMLEYIEGRKAICLKENI